MASVSGTLTNGIQDISALLPLLGTDQCETHVSCALDKGFLYAAAAPLSIFGSLGVVKAGFKVFLASLNFRHFGFVGAKWLENAGFAPDGSAAAKNNAVSLLAMEGTRYVAEARFDAMLNQAHIPDINKVVVRWDCFWWNVYLVLFSLAAGLLALSPYIPLVSVGDFHDSGLSWNLWVFPAMRAVGTSLTAVVIQIILQFRILEITRKRLFLKKLQKDDRLTVGILKELDYSLSADECIWKLEERLEENILSSKKQRVISAIFPGLHKSSTVDTEAARDAASAEEWMSARQIVLDKLNQDLPLGQSFSHAWLLFALQCLLVFGLVMSVGGYLGCFNAVQTSSSSGPLLWVALEVALSVLRIIIWASNPEWDDSTNIDVHVDLGQQPPLITCNNSMENLLEAKTLSVLRADDFLKDLTVYTGPIAPLLYDKITLYYALIGSSVTGEKVLYVTISDYSEQATWALRVDSQFLDTIRSDGKHSFSLHAANVEVDSLQNSLTVTLQDQVDATSLPITRDPIFTTRLTLHCLSIMLAIVDSRQDKSATRLRLLWSLSAQAGTSNIDYRSRLSALTGKITQWPRLGEADRVYLGLGELQTILTSYARNRVEWIIQSTDVLHINSITSVNDFQLHLPESPPAIILLDWEVQTSLLIDLQEHKDMEMIWECEAAVLVEISLFYLRVLVNGNRQARDRLCDEWLKNMRTFYETERESSRERLRFHISASAPLDSEIEEACQVVERQWQKSFAHLKDAVNSCQPIVDGRPSVEQFRSDLMLKWVTNPPFPSSDRPELGVAIPPRLEHAHSRLCSVLSKPENNLGVVTPSSVHSYQVLLEIFMRKRRQMDVRLEVERRAALARISRVLDTPSDDDTLPSIPPSQFPSSDSDGPITSWHSQVRRVLESYTVANVSRLAGTILSTQRNYRLDMTPRIEEFCEVIVRNRRAALIKLGTAGGPKTESLAIQKCADALIQREALTSIIVENVQLDTEAIHALLHAVQHNDKLISLRFGPQHSIPRLESQLMLAALRRNRRRVKTESHTTDIIYGSHHDTFDVYDIGYTGTWFKPANHCTIFFDSPSPNFRNTVALSVHIVIQLNIEDGESTRNSFIVKLNGEIMALDVPGLDWRFLKVMEGIDSEEHHYSLRIPKYALHDQPRRNQLSVTANEPTCQLKDVIIHDQLGSEWEGNMLDLAYNEGLNAISAPQVAELPQDGPEISLAVPLTELAVPETVFENAESPTRNDHPQRGDDENGAEAKHEDATAAHGERNTVVTCACLPRLLRR